MVALEARRLAWAVAHPAPFLRFYGRIKDPAGRGPQPLDWWPYLDELLTDWCRQDRSILLKARQLGVSWLLAGFGLWTSLFTEGANVLVLSKSEEDAAEIIARARFMADGLPDEFGAADRETDNTTTLTFRGSGGRLRAYAATGHAGRGQTGTLVILDEFAHHPDQEQGLAAVLPTVADGTGRVVVVSTANGVGDTFETLWSGAPANGWHPRFLPWHARPGRTEAWRRERQAELPNPALVDQEYPASERQAFVQSGGTVFGDYLHLHPGLVLGRPDWSMPELRRLEGLELFGGPRADRWYAAGADCAEGIATGDANCVQVLDPERGEQVVHWHQRLEPDRFADGIDAIAREYPGLYGIERNGPGLAVLSHLRAFAADGAYQLYYRTRELEEPTPGQFVPIGPGKDLGWRTTAQNKPRLIGDLERSLREDVTRIGSRETFQQLRAFRQGQDGRLGAPSGRHDDCVIALAIAVRMALWSPTYQPREPRTLRTFKLDLFGTGAGARPYR